MIKDYGVCTLNNKTYLIIPDKTHIFMFETGGSLERPEEFVKYKKILNLTNNPKGKYGCRDKDLAIVSKLEGEVIYLLGGECINLFSDTDDSFVIGAKYTGELSFAVTKEMLLDIAEFAITDANTDTVHIYYNGDDSLLLFTNATFSWLWAVAPMKINDVEEKYKEWFDSKPE